jgi:hypothetical protein
MISSLPPVRAMVLEEIAADAKERGWVAAGTDRLRVVTGTTP